MNMKRIYEKPLMKDHKLQQNNYLLVVNSKGEEDLNEKKKEEEFIDDVW